MKMNLTGLLALTRFLIPNRVDIAEEINDLCSQGFIKQLEREYRGCWVLHSVCPT